MSSKRKIKRRSRAQQTESRSGLKSYILIIGVIAGVVAVVSGIVILDQGRSRTSSVSTSLAEVSLDKSTGPEDAPVVVVEYGDFQCPHCRQFAIGTERQLKEDYADTGQVRFVFRHFAFIGDESLWAAEATECANEQGRFWEYHDKLFEEQGGENVGVFSPANLKGFAADLELDTEQFNQCLDSGKYEAKVKQETAEGQRNGVRGTPTVFVNGQMINNGSNYQVLQGAIEAILNRQ
jgi:protein-disulfide isomerase